MLPVLASWVTGDMLCKWGFPPFNNGDRVQRWLRALWVSLCQTVSRVIMWVVGLEHWWYQRESEEGAEGGPLLVIAF